MATSKKQEEETGLQVFMSFKDNAFPGLIIVWKVGENKLTLCRMNSPKNTKLEDKHHHTYKTAEGAYAGAVRWFALLANIYNTAATEAKQQVVVTH